MTFSGFFDLLMYTQRC